MDGELLSLKWNNHRSTFIQVVGGLRIKATYTDATLACSGKFYPVHRLVLSSCSEYFDAIFEHTTCKNPVIVLKDIESKNLEYLLDYMYIGEVNVRQNELGALVGAAECLKIKGLAVPDGDTSKASSNFSNSSKNKLNNRPRSSSPPSKRKKLSKLPDYLRHTTKKNEETLFNSAEAMDQTLIDTSFSVKLEPNETEDSNSSNQEAQITGQNSPQQPRKTESEHAEGTQGIFVIEKEEPIEITDHSSDIGSSLLYDDDENSWKGDDIYQPELLDDMGGPINSEPSCSSQQQDQQLENPLWPTDYLELDSIASTSTQIDPITSLQDQFGSKIKSLKEEYSKRKMGDRSSDNFVSRQLSSSHSSLQLINRFYRRSGQCFMCNLCPYKSKLKTNLKRHMMTHTGEKPFKCPHCEYRSVAFHTIKRHFRTHTGEKPHRCSICDFGCSSIGTLRRHMSKHT